jgi:hypothetical protein
VLLAISAEQEEDLCLESVSSPVCVEITQEWVLFEHFKQYFGRQCLAKDTSQAGLSDANRALDSDVRM